MKRIMVTGAGGSPATGFVRSLRDAPEPYYLIGVDVDPYNLQRAQTDECHLVPRVTDPDYLPIMLDIISQTRPHLLHVQISSEMVALSKLRGALPCTTFLPRHATVVTCDDKFASYDCWSRAGLVVPETVMLNEPADLAEAFERFGPRLWLRFTVGSAGRGALGASDLREARLWVDSHGGWGHFTAARWLDPHTVTWQSIWRNGELIVAQGRKRLYWEFANRAPSGVTGITGTGVTVRDPVVDQIAQRAVKAIDPTPMGIFGVDLTYDRDGVPNPTEINVGRFFTTHQFFTAAGLNMPYIFVKSALGETLPYIARTLNPLEPGLAWVRGMDVEPILTTERRIAEARNDLMRRRARVLMPRAMGA